MIPDADHWWMTGVTEAGDVVTFWDGGGRVANEKGDLYGTAPHRIIRFGLVSLAAERAEAAVEAGWRWRAEQPDLRDWNEGDPLFARLERTEVEREAR